MRPVRSLLAAALLCSNAALAQRAPVYFATPAPREAPAVVALADGGALVVAGRLNGAEALATWRYEPRARSMRVVAALPESVDRGLVFGTALGVLAVAGRTANAYLFDTAREQWHQVGSLALPRDASAGALASDGSVWVCGGDDPRTSRPLRSCERFDPRTRVFAHAASMQSARSSHALAALGDGSIVALGGHSYVDPQTGATVSRHWPMDSVERWTPGAREFVRVAALERAHYGLSARQLGGGSLLVSGGTGDYGEMWGAGSELVRLGGNARELTGCVDAERSLGTTLLPLRDRGVLVVGALADATPMRVWADGRCGARVPELTGYGSAGWAVLIDGSVLGVGQRGVVFGL